MLVPAKISVSKRYHDDRDALLTLVLGAYASHGNVTLALTRGCNRRCITDLAKPYTVGRLIRALTHPCSCWYFLSLYYPTYPIRVGTFCCIKLTVMVGGDPDCRLSWQVICHAAHPVQKGHIPGQVYWVVWHLLQLQLSHWRYTRQHPVMVSAAI